MSQVMLKVKTNEINQRKLVDSNFADVYVSENVQEVRQSMSMQVAIAYDFELSLKVKAYVESPEDLKAIATKARLHIAEEMFGEFRLLLAKLDNALYLRDYKEATRISNLIGYKMFDEIN